MAGWLSVAGWPRNTSNACRQTSEVRCNACGQTSEVRCGVAAALEVFESTLDVDRLSRMHYVLRQTKTLFSLRRLPSPFSVQPAEAAGWREVGISGGTRAQSPGNNFLWGLG